MTLAEKHVDPWVKRTRQLLQQAFMELFREKGMASISVQDITEPASPSPPADKQS
jgi:AcrR family transcriptional regulator